MDLVWLQPFVCDCLDISCIPEIPWIPCARGVWSFASCTSLLWASPLSAWLGLLERLGRLERLERLGRWCFCLGKYQGSQLQHHLKWLDRSPQIAIRSISCFSQIAETWFAGSSGAASHYKREFDHFSSEMPRLQNSDNALYTKKPRAETQGWVAHKNLRHNFARPRNLVITIVCQSKEGCVDRRVALTIVDRLYYIILYYIILYCIILYYIMLYYSILYYIILYYIILYYIVYIYIILHIYIYI